MKSLILMTLLLAGCATLKEDAKPKHEKQLEFIQQKQQSKRP